MACKRDFYYKYILRLHEQDEFEDEMTASTFGTIVHKVLEDGFNGLKNRVLQTEDLERLMKNIPPLLQASVAEEQLGLDGERRELLAFCHRGSHVAQTDQRRAQGIAGRSGGP